MTLRIRQSQRARNFLQQLADLMDDYDASMSYNTNDDGIHIRIDGGDEVFIGFIDSAADIRKQIK